MSVSERRLFCALSTTRGEMQGREREGEKGVQTHVGSGEKRCGGRISGPHQHQAILVGTPDDHKEASRTPCYNRTPNYRNLTRGNVRVLRDIRDLHEVHRRQPGFPKRLCCCIFSNVRS